MSPRQSSTTRTRKGANGNESQTNAIALLKADHRKVTGLFREFESAESVEEKARIARDVCNELIVHTMLEEEIFYAACREANVDTKMLDEAQVEHDGAKLLILELMAGQPDAPFYDAKMSVLSEYIKHHVGEEEKTGSGIFARAKAAKLDMNALGQRLQERRSALLEAGNHGFSPPVPRSLNAGMDNRNQEMSDMERQYGRDRDDQGRFSGDDDRGGSRGRSRYEEDEDYRRGGGRFSSRSGGGRDRDEEGRFASQEDRSGYSRSRGRGDDDYGNERGDRFGGGRGGFQDRERDEQGRFMSDEDRGYSSRSRGGREDDYDDRGGGRSGGGRGGFQDRERDEQGRFMGDDDRGYSSRSRGGRQDDDDDDRRGGRSGGGRGWFGDPEGHSRASEEGWENRGRSRSSRDDDERSSRGGSSGGRGQGQGGWFGDSRGHAEAARRGWRDR